MDKKEENNEVKLNFTRPLPKISRLSPSRIASIDIPQTPQSPIQEKRMNLELRKEELEIEKENEKWATCCSRTNKHFLKYAIQVTVGFMIMLFSMIQIIRDVDGQEIYFSLLSGTAGSFLPAPHLPDETKKS